MPRIVTAGTMTSAPGQEFIIMNVSLTPELEKFVADKVKTGLYNNASEVVRTSLRLLSSYVRRVPLELD